MTILPPVEPALSENPNPFGQAPTEIKKPYRVTVVNRIWNGGYTIRRKKAEHYVEVGRAEWVGPNQLRMLMTHPANIAAMTRASAGYHAVNRLMKPQELANIGVLRPLIAYHAK